MIQQRSFCSCLVTAYRRPDIGDEHMSLKRFVTSTAVIAALTLPALSALAQDSAFYIVQDVKTKKCTIVDKKPTTTTTTVVDNGVFKTRTEAETGMKTMKVCTEN